MKNIFDYTYYRIAKSYFKKDGLDAITAILTITIIKFLYLLSLFFFVKDFFFFTNEGRKVGLIEKGILIAIMYLIYLQTNRRYKEKYLYFRKKWINEEKNKKRVNGFLVIP